jgi:hypothetical protein
MTNDDRRNPRSWSSRPLCDVIEPRARLDRLRPLLSGRPDEQASALLRVDRPPASKTDVIDAIRELVTRVGPVLSRCEHRQQHDGAVVAGSEMSPIALRPFAPFPCVVRSFGGGAKVPAA